MRGRPRPLGRDRTERGLPPVLRRGMGLLTVLILLVPLGEIIVRIFPELLPAALREVLDLGSTPRARMRKLHRPDPYFGYKMKPEMSATVAARDRGDPPTYRLRTDLHGFRHARFPENASLVVLGDDAVLGIGVSAEEAFPNLLAERLGVQTANLGVAGYGPPQATRVLRRYGVVLRPRGMVYAVAQDDFLDAARFREWLDAGSPGEYLAYRPSWTRARPAGTGEGLAGFLRSWMYRHSALYQFARYQAASYVPGLDWRPVPVLGCHAAGIEIDLDARSFSLTNLAYPPIAGGLRTVRSALADAEAVTRAEGMGFLVVSIPTPEQLFAHRLSAGSFGSIPHARASRSDLVTALCTDLGIECVDLLPAFEAAVEAGILPFDPRSGVLATEGHRVAAGIVAERVDRLGWFSAAPPTEPPGTGFPRAEAQRRGG